MTLTTVGRDSCRDVPGSRVNDSQHPGPSSEEWRPIPQWEGVYEISNRARVRNISTGRVLKATIRPDGYWTHNLKSKGRRAGILTHRVMLTVFVSPPPTPSHHARHLDGNPRNCTLENLAWGTPKENAADKIRHGTALAGERSPQARLTEADVLAIRAMRGTVHPDEAALRYGVHRTYVYMIWRGETWRHLSA